MSNTRKATSRRLDASTPRDRYARQDAARRRPHHTDAARRPAHQPRPEDDLDEVYDGDEPATAEMAKELDARGAYVTASLCDEPVRIVPPGAWRQSWMRLLNEGRLDDFAGKVIHPDDLDLYDDLDPTNDEFGQFVADAAELAGESLGKSRGPAPSSRRTRRR